MDIVINTGRKENDNRTRSKHMEGEGKRKTGPKAKLEGQIKEHQH